METEVVAVRTKREVTASGWTWVFSVIVAAAKAQMAMSRREVEDFVPVLTMPLFAFVFGAVLIYSGRADLAPYALVASLLMTVAQTGIFVASEVLTRERNGETLELVVATPAPFFAVLFARCFVQTSIGLIGLIESWIIVRVVFDVEITIHHGWVLVATILLTVFAAACTALVMAALFSMARSTRTFQNTVSYGLFLLAGVLVPVSFLPDWLEPFSRLLFLYWSADLVRDCLQSPAIEDVGLRLGAILMLGLIAAAAGSLMIQRMLHHLRHEGTLAF
jgi:ABC-2 type transport system permease protein